ncbi:hypothetical protein B0H14DRAFT_2750043 [Mycena olivaceomarginata]|nr:hypothetical protein B0H14DRAFT_2750043 [Mycena olivaceomarginata]
MSPTPPPADSLDAIGDGLTAATAIASQAVALRAQSSHDPQIEALRSELLTALSSAGANFRCGLERGEDYALAGTKVAKNVIYVLDQFIKGELETAHIPDIARSLDKPITQLLESAKEMHKHFGAVKTALEKVTMKTQMHGQHVDRAIAEAEKAIKETKSRRERNIVFAGLLGLVSFIFPPAAPFTGPLAAGLAVRADALHKDVIHGLTAIQPWSVFADNLSTVEAVVGRAQDVTATHILFWLQMRNQVNQLQDTSADWLEDLSSEFLAKKLRDEWKDVEIQYSQLTHKTSDAHRFLDAHLE